MKNIDRKKNIFKLSQGEYIDVENLENVFGLFSDLDLVCLVAVANPNQKAIEHFTEAYNISGDFEALCENPKIKEYVLGELPKVGKENKLEGFEFGKAIHLDPVTFIVIMKVVTGALDMVTFGAKNTIPMNFQQRKIYEHNEQVTSDPYVVLQLDSQIVKKQC
ncbi:unnamed protein product [Lactuca saligna]|uniref:UPF0261 domain-containing protein n=1 Tax=Lactuca saligna TaxID=75948 RepID=A0AA35XZY5_LACSI|nr:unnamed protein product [Lactuca saligna]